MAYVKNAQQLLSHGNANARRAALQIIEAALAKADPYRATREVVRIEGNRLSVADRRFDLNRNRRIILLGAGKATFPIAKALEEILGDRINGGIVVCKYGQAAFRGRICIWPATRFPMKPALKHLKKRLLWQPAHSPETWFSAVSPAAGRRHRQRRGGM
jgi:glycerate-2-kinase